VEEISKNTLRKIKIAKFIILQILFFVFYFLIGKYDWDYGFDLPFRLYFGGMFSIITGIIFGIMFYFMGKKTEYENDKILKLPIFFIILSVILLFRIDIIVRIEGSFGQYRILVPFFLINVFFGLFIKKYFDKEEIEVVRILTITGCLIIMGIFVFMGFNWYKEDYHAIIYTFPYKVLMYLEEGENSVEKFGIIKTLESRYFVYAMVVNMGFYLGTLKINNKDKRRNCVENQIDGDS